MLFSKKLDPKKLKKYYFDELRKKDREIDALKQRLNAALNSAIKQGMQKNQVQDYAKKLLDINKKLNEQLKIGKSERFSTKKKKVNK